eukprot:123495-Chlamydomonas_euryale.AAC.2
MRKGCVENAVRINAGKVCPEVVWLHEGLEDAAYSISTSTATGGDETSGPAGSTESSCRWREKDGGVACIRGQKGIGCIRGQKGIGCIRGQKGT